MTTMQKRTTMSLPAVVLLGLFVAIPPAVRADVHRPAAVSQQQVVNELSDFKLVAQALRQEADSLQAYNRNRQMDWRSHADRLNALREHTNDLGKSLMELEEMKAAGNENHQMAIENVRPHLEEIAQNLTRALDLLREDRSSVRWNNYIDTVGDLYGHADLMYQKLDTILDYDKAERRLANAQAAWALER